MDQVEPVLDAGELPAAARGLVHIVDWPFQRRLAVRGRARKVTEPLTAMYLARQMHDRTVLVLTGSTLALIETSCTMARLLQPATVILEDVDLVAEERSRQGTGANTILFELQPDGRPR